MLAAAFAAVAIGAGAVGGVAGGALASGNTPVASGGTVTTQQAASKTSAQTIASIAAKVSPSVVQVEVETYQGQAIGSGVILSSDGKILTNAHVVAGASDSGAVKITFSDGKTANATVLGSDTSSDLAVLQAENVDGLKAATLGDSSSVQVGDEVVAIGSPEGLQGTVTSGIVSALDRDVTVGSENQQQDQRNDDLQGDPDRRVAEPRQLRRTAAQRERRSDRHQLRHLLPSLGLRSSRQRRARVRDSDQRGEGDHHATGERQRKLTPKGYRDRADGGARFPLPARRRQSRCTQAEASTRAASVSRRSGIRA
jgi:hypothetical protein